MTLPRRKPARMGVREAPQVRNRAHLQWVRGHACAIADKHHCEGRIEAAHVRTGTDGGMGVKPSDSHTLPLCSTAHHEQHQIGERAFELKYKVKLLEFADDLWRRSPHRAKSSVSATGENNG